MFKHFIKLEWKSFLRSASFGSNLALKIIMGIFAGLIILEFLLLGLFSFDIMEDYGLKPFETVNKYLVYYVLIDLLIRYFLQKMPVTNIRPLLLFPIKKSSIVHYSLGKTAISFFNVMHAFFFVPFTVRILFEGYGYQAVLWHFGILSIIYCNNFINVLANNKDAVLYGVLTILTAFGVLQYYDFFDFTIYSKYFFQGMYETNYLFLIPLILMVATYYFSFNYFKNRLNLDDGLAKKSDIAKTENFNWLNQFGSLGTFLKNDIRLLKRNKRSRTTVVMSVIFIFYGLLFFTKAIEVYNSPAWHVFAGIFVSGGFLFVFGQFVPSWDSAYYQLMMSQNIQYREYISAKWWLMVIATIITTLLASFYLYFGLHIYLVIVVAAIFNIGVNSHLVMLGGAFVKTPIDLTTSKQAFGDKQAFNVKTMLIAIPKMLLPMGLYALGYYVFSPNIGLLFVALAGVLGFAFRNYVFNQIEKIYKTEKYATIEAYKKKN